MTHHPNPASPRPVTYHLDVDATLAMMLHARTADEALALLQTPPGGAAIAKSIASEWAADPAAAMAQVALQRRAMVASHDAHNPHDVERVIPLFKGLGYSYDDLFAHLPRAIELYAAAVTASAQVLARTCGAVVPQAQSEAECPVVPKAQSGADGKAA
ncbi:MAG: hypothetical protein AAF739_00455 [Pseudomonadota bacterium]